MGGFAVDIDWAGTGSGAIENMMEAIPHRAVAGSVATNLGPAHLGETRLGRDGEPGWTIARLGNLALVGDLRLWDLDPLRRITGPDTDDTRFLVLAGYEALGPAVMDLVDGDFTFAIWDERRRYVFAARDRFGVKPLWV